MTLIPQYQSNLWHFVNKAFSSVIAIHGLGADPDWSWKDKASGVSWIRDTHMLPSAIPNARILRFGYDAKWWGEGSVRARIPDLAKNLLHDILNEPERKVFCSH